MPPLHYSPSLAHQVHSLRHIPTRVTPALSQQPVSLPTARATPLQHFLSCTQVHPSEFHIKENPWFSMIYSNSFTCDLRASTAWSHSPYKAFSPWNLCFIQAKHVTHFPTSLTLLKLFPSSFSEEWCPNQRWDHDCVTSAHIIAVSLNNALLKCVSYIKLSPPFSYSSLDMTQNNYIFPVT